MTEVTRLLADARGGDVGAWDRAVALVYQDLKRLARGVLAGGAAATLNPTALVHDCYLRMSRAGPDGVLNRGHFMALAATAMRQLMSNHARDKLAEKRGGGLQLDSLNGDTEVVAAAQGQGHAAQISAEAEQLLELDSALEQLQTENPEWVRVVECRIFVGLTETETAEALELPLRSCQRLWADARKRLAELLD